MSGPDLHVFTLKFLALKKNVFFTFSGTKQNLRHSTRVSGIDRKHLHSHLRICAALKKPVLSQKKTKKN